VLYELSVIHGPVPPAISLAISRLSAATRVAEVASRGAVLARGVFQKLSAAKRRVGEVTGFAGAGLGPDVAGPGLGADVVGAGLGADVAGADGATPRLPRAGTTGLLLPRTVRF
jgi:hypothetical protein